MNIPRIMLFFAILSVMPIIGYAQCQYGVSAGLTGNTLFFHDATGTESTDLYGPAVGFTAGGRLKCTLSNRLGIGAELNFQMLPYTIKYMTGNFRPTYVTVAAVPSLRLLHWLEVEGGIGTGITVSSRLGDKGNKDPLLTGLIGLRFPCKNWEFNIRYYRSLRPLYEEQSIRSERKYYGQGIQTGVTYYLW